MTNQRAEGEPVAPLPSTSEARDPETVKAFARLKRGIIMRSASPEPLDPRWDERYEQDRLAVVTAITAAAMAEAQERIEALEGAARALLEAGDNEAEVSMEPFDAAWDALRALQAPVEEKPNG